MVSQLICCKSSLPVSILCSKSQVYTPSTLCLWHLINRQQLQVPRLVLSTRTFGVRMFSFSLLRCIRPVCVCNEYDTAHKQTPIYLNKLIIDCQVELRQPFGIGSITQGRLGESVWCGWRADCIMIDLKLICPFCASTNS